MASQTESRSFLVSGYKCLARGLFTKLNHPQGERNGTLSAYQHAT